MYTFSEVVGIIKDLIPHIDVFMDNGYTKEEMKMVLETQKIMGDSSIRVTATCVRVPVVYGHSEAVNISTSKKVSPDEVRQVLAQAPGVLVVDDPANKRYPMPLEAAGQDLTLDKAPWRQLLGQGQQLGPASAEVVGEGKEVIEAYLIVRAEQAQDNQVPPIVGSLPHPINDGHQNYWNDVVDVNQAYPGYPPGNHAAKKRSHHVRDNQAPDYGVGERQVPVRVYHGRTRGHPDDNHCHEVNGHGAASGYAEKQGGDEVAALYRVVGALRGDDTANIALAKLAGIAIGFFAIFV